MLTRQENARTNTGVWILSFSLTKVMGKSQLKESVSAQLQEPPLPWDRGFKFCRKTCG